jgi:hypothetical protein
MIVAFTRTRTMVSITTKMVRQVTPHSPIFWAIRISVEKTMLFLIDGLCGNDNVDGPPHRKWKIALFDDAWPNSIFMSLDSVAIDSVGFDFLTSEWPDLPDIANADNYLRESALANDPPSKTFYDPERDGIRCRSLGVHEHWNNGTDKKYSRNLGKAHGIELFQV